MQSAAAALVALERDTLNASQRPSSVVTSATLTTELWAVRLTNKARGRIKERDDTVGTAGTYRVVVGGSCKGV